jgi:hypothetical protein
MYEGGFKPKNIKKSQRGERVAVFIDIFRLNRH